MASGDPVTSILTAPQKQLPTCVMAFPFLFLRYWSVSARSGLLNGLGMICDNPVEHAGVDITEI
jgi:hypothetical protein